MLTLTNECLIIFPFIKTSHKLVHEHFAVFGTTRIEERDNNDAIYSALFNMYDIADNCKRSFEKIRTEMKNDILRTLNAYEGIVYRLNALGWKKYDDLSSPQRLVRVHGSSDHWYVLDWGEWD